MDEKPWWQKALSWIGDKGLNLAMQWLGMEQQNSNIDKQLEAQKQEQAKNREFNYQLWQDDNAYNTPSAQKARLEQAGLNADMMYGGSGVMNTSSSAPSPSQAMDWSALANKRTIGDVTSQALDNQMKQAQIDNIKANTKKQGAETDILSTDAAFREAYNRGLIETQNMQINLGKSQTDLNDANTSKVRAEIQKINQECVNLTEQLNVFRAEIANLDADTAYKKVKKAIDKLIADGQIKEMASRCNLNDAQAKQIAEMLPHLTNEAASRNGLLLEQGALLRFQKDRVEIDLKNAKNHYSQLGGTWDSVYTAVTFVNDLVGALSPLVPKMSLGSTSN